MSRCYGARVVAVLVILMLAVPVLAKPMKTSFTLGQTVKLAGTTLDAGEYFLIADDAKVTVKKGAKVMVEAPAKWEEAKTKASATAVIVRGDTVAEIRIGGKTKYLVF